MPATSRFLRSRLVLVFEFIPIVVFEISASGIAFKLMRTPLIWMLYKRQELYSCLFHFLSACDK